MTQLLLNSGKAPSDSKAMLMSLEEQKFFKGCSKVGACYQCFKKFGEMSALWKDCLKHNKFAIKGYR